MIIKKREIKRRIEKIMRIKRSRKREVLRNDKLCGWLEMVNYFKEVKL